MYKGKARKLVAVLLFLVLIFNSATALAQSKASGVFSSNQEDNQTKAKNKIESNFIDSLSDDEYAEAIVYLKSQVDSMEVASEAKSKLSSALTPYKTKIEVRKELILTLKDNAENTQQKLLKYVTQEKGKGNVEEYKPYYIINAVYVKATKDVIKNIAYMNEVEKIYKSKIIKLDQPKITKNKTQANANGVEWNVEKVKADEVWDLGVDGTGIVVGTIDTGATWTHPALQGKWRGYNQSNPNNPNPEGNWYDPINGTTLPADEPSIPHGTHVLGTILGGEPDGSNKIGVAPGAKWIAAKAFTPDGGSDSNILSAAQWMLAPGGDPAAAPDVINNSWGGASGLDEWFKPMVTAWRAAGIVPIFSAGNQSDGAAPVGSVSAPANYAESFAVGATDINNVRGDFSRRGPGPYNNLKPDVSAPGVNIRSSVPGGYESGWDGTSMAAPAVTGTVALILSANNSLSIEEVESLLKDTAVHLEDSDDSGSPNNGYGYGLINAFEAVSRIAGGTGTIEGKVTVEGEDKESPVINHTQEVFDTYIGSSLNISAEISDDVSIVESQLLVKESGKSYWTTLPMTRTSGDHKLGVYTATIPADLMKQAGISYKIKARDYDSNEVATQEYKIAVRFGALPDEYETNFETAPIGWSYEGDWQWGEPKEGVGATPLSGTKLLGTNLIGNYSANSDSILISPPLDLRNTDLSFAQFRINQWYDMENIIDKGYIYVTNDFGDTLTQIGPTYTGSQTQWKETVINLNQYIGSQNPVYIIFRMTSDSSTQKAGWYLEDAKLIATDPVVPTTPTRLSGRVLFDNVALNWSPAPDSDISKYKIYRSNVAGGEYTFLGESSGTSYGDSNITEGTTYYYKVSSCDYAGNESGLSDAITVIVDQLGNYVFLADLEQNNGNFITGGTNNSWEWGVPLVGPEGSLYGQKVWATNLKGNYQNSSNCFIETPEIQLPVSGSSVLTVGQWYELEDTYDKGYIQISKKSGGTWSAWTNLAPNGYLTGDGKVWTDLSIPLNSSYAGQTVKVRFLLTTDSSVTNAGWYIDYVMINTANGLNKNIIKKIDSKNLDQIKNSPKMKKETDIKPLKLNLRVPTSKVEYKTISDEAVKSIDLVTASLPMDAVVTVLETGKSVRTNPADGRYSMKLPANKGDETYTLKVEAYGYKPTQAKVHLVENQNVKKNFVLEEVPKGTIVGKVVDRYSKEPVTNATVRVIEDPKISSVTTDKDGTFVMSDVYEGSYTLKVSTDGFEPGTKDVIVVGNKSTDISILLKRFVGYDEEIVYDDGTGENALVMNAAGNGLAIRVTPAQYGKVKGANIFFWGTDWPSPGGTQIGITIYDTDKDGNPVKLNNQPKVVNVVRGEWNYIDLSEFNFQTDRDFFIATRQIGAGTSSPGTGIDSSSPYGERSYLYSGDTFTPLAKNDTEGSLMIRARMEYSVDTPQITNLKEVNYTNKDSILVEGKVTADGTVNLYANGSKVDEVKTTNKTFSKVIKLTKDETIITASSVLNGKETEPSAPKTVIKDKVAPELVITKPSDGFKTKERVVDITGTVTDLHYDKLQINGEAVEVTDGTFHVEKILQPGDNTFTIEAYDLAGNLTKKSITVVLKKELPVITDLEPSEDVHIAEGEALTVSFRSEPGGEGAFRVVLPSQNTPQSNQMIPMEEVSEGYYVGTWTAQAGSLDGLVVEAEYTDSAGNTVSATAEGKINVVANQGIRDLTPSKDVTLTGGDVLTVGFRSPRGGAAYFKMFLPNGGLIKAIPVSMTEVSPGYYEGTFIVPEKIMISGIVIKVFYTDTNGKITTATAEGKVSIDNSNDDEATKVETPAGMRLLR